MTAREVVDKLYRETQRRFPSYGEIIDALRLRGYEVPKSLSITWSNRVTRVKLSSGYSRPRDRVRAFRVIDRWLAAQIDAKKQEVLV